MHVRTRSTIRFARDLEQHGDAVAVVEGTGSVSYRELAARADDAAAALGPRRQLVAVATANELEAIVWYLAALRAGHPVLLVPADDAARADALLRAWEPAVVVAPTDGRWVPRERDGAVAHDLHPDLALLLSTSGSTGSPKLVRLSHANLQANAESIVGSLGIDPTDRAMTTLPLHYCYGLSVVHSHLAAGAALVLSDLSVVDPCFWETFRAAGATSFAGVPHTFDLLDRVGFDSISPTLEHLRTITQAGGRLAPERVTRYAELGERDGWDLVVMYGQTEATARMAFLPPPLARAHPTAIGVPVPGGELRLEPVDGVVDPEVGELVYEGPNVMLGYATEHEDLGAGRSTEFLRTGDLGRRTGDGLYEVVGRRSRFLKLFGLRVDLQHVEDLLAHEGVEARCTGDDQRLVIAVTSGGGVNVADAVRRHVQLPRSAVRVLHLDVLPRLPSGKVDDPELRRLAADDPAGAAGTGAAPPGTSDVTALYAHVLGRSPVTPGDTFVDLGGDSLSYVEVSVRLEELLGTLPAGWHQQSVGELEALGALEAGGSPRRRRLKRVETNVVLRAVAIVMIVATHAGSIEQRGGAHVLLAIAGFNLARFQLGTRHPARQLARGALRIAAPAMAWIGLLVLVTDGYGLPNIFLVNGHLGAMDFDERWRFWFVEVLVQGLLVLAAAFALPPVRRLERRQPFAFALGVVLVALALRHGLVDVLDARHRTVQPQTIFWVLALGWAVQRATSVPRRLLVSALVVASVPGFFFGEGVREAVIIGGILLLAWVPRLAVPRPLDRVAAPLASASLWIYLTHWHVHGFVSERSSALVATVASVLVGVAAWWLEARIRAGVASPQGDADRRAEAVPPV